MSAAVFFFGMFNGATGAGTPVVATIGGNFEFNGSIRTITTSADEIMSSLSSRVAGAIDSVASVLRAIQAISEFLTSVRSRWGAPLEYSGAIVITAASALPLESFTSVSKKTLAALEYTQGVTVISSTGLMVEWTGSIKSSIGSPLEWSSEIVLIRTAIIGDSIA